jgi:hypothetical protein
LEAQKIMDSQGNTEDITKANFKLHYRAIAIKQHGTSTETNMKTSETERRPRYESMQLCPPDF